MTHRRIARTSSLAIALTLMTGCMRSAPAPTPARSTLRLGDEVRVTRPSSTAIPVRGCLLAANGEVLTLRVIPDTTTGATQPWSCARDTIGVVERVPWGDDVVVAIPGWEAVSRGLATPRDVGWEGPTPALLGAGIGAVGCAAVSFASGGAKGVIMAPGAAIVCGFMGGVIALLAFGNEPVVRAGTGVRLEVEPWVTVPDARDQVRRGALTPSDSTTHDR